MNVKTYLATLEHQLFNVFCGIYAYFVSYRISLRFGPREPIEISDTTLFLGTIFILCAVMTNAYFINKEQK